MYENNEKLIYLINVSIMHFSVAFVPSLSLSSLILHVRAFGLPLELPAVAVDSTCGASDSMPYFLIIW